MFKAKVINIQNSSLPDYFNTFYYFQGSWGYFCLLCLYGGKTLEWHAAVHLSSTQY